MSGGRQAGGEFSRSSDTGELDAGAKQRARARIRFAHLWLVFQHVEQLLQRPAWGWIPASR